MRRLLIFVVVLAIIVGLVGWWRGWWTVAVNQDKIQQDEQTLKEKARGLQDSLKKDNTPAPATSK